MDTYLAIASKRDERRYADRPVPEDVERRILDAGRLSGNSQNRQEWEFVVVSDRMALAEAVYAPQNVETAALVVAVVAKRAFDAGRAAQNMMLAAWNDGVVSCRTASETPRPPSGSWAPGPRSCSRSAIRRGSGTPSRGAPTSGRGARTASRSTS